MNEKILVVDKDDNLMTGLKFSLEQEGYEIETAHDGKVAYDLIMNNSYDMVILEIDLPSLSGLEVCRKVREKKSTPILILTEQSEVSSKVLGLEYGADDYVTKPFIMLELKARMKAIFRRSFFTNVIQPTNIIHTGDFTINTLGRKVTVKDKQVNLTAKEFDLFLLLVLNDGKVYSREELLESIWGYEYFGDVRTVDVHIRRLREKIEEDSSHPEYIQTKWGVGYYFNVNSVEM